MYSLGSKLISRNKKNPGSDLIGIVLISLFQYVTIEIVSKNKCLVKTQKLFKKKKSTSINIGSGSYRLIQYTY